MLKLNFFIVNYTLEFNKYQKNKIHPWEVTGIVKEILRQQMRTVQKANEGQFLVSSIDEDAYNISTTTKRVTDKSFPLSLQTTHVFYN